MGGNNTVRTSKYIIRRSPTTMTVVGDDLDVRPLDFETDSVDVSGSEIDTTDAGIHKQLDSLHEIQMQQLALLKGIYLILAQASNTTVSTDDTENIF